MHQTQAGITANKGLGRLAAKHICPILPGALQSCKITVIPAVIAVQNTILFIRQYSQQSTHKIQLCTAGLATGHIQFQILRLQGCKTSLHFLCLILEFFHISASVGTHFHHSFRENPSYTCNII